MNLVVTLLSLLAIVVLTFGTALFVAAEFSLTALEEAPSMRTPAAAAGATARCDAPTAPCRSSCPGRSWASRSPPWSPVTWPSRWWRSCSHPALDAPGVPRRVATAVIALLALVVATSLSMVLGELVPKNLAVARPLATAAPSPGLSCVLLVFTAGDHG